MIRTLTFLTTVALLTAAAIAQDTNKNAPPAPADAKQLFNGKDLTGWDGDPRLWSVKDGVIRGETTDQNKANGNTFLILKDTSVADFDLRLSFRLNAANNSGIQYRSKHMTEARNNKWSVRGYQHELRNQNKLPDVSGFIYDEGGGRGRLCFVGEKATWEADPADPKGKKNVTGQLIDAEAFQKLFKLDDWNETVIIARGNNIKHYLNGTLVVDFTDNHPERALKEGIIALQLHAGRPMWIEFKDIRLAELSKK
jgi:hypothetical protein